MVGVEDKDHFAVENRGPSSSISRSLSFSFLHLPGDLPVQVPEKKNKNGRGESKSRAPGAPHAVARAAKRGEELAKLLLLGVAQGAGGWKRVAWAPW